MRCPERHAHGRLGPPPIFLPLELTALSNEKRGLPTLSSRRPPRWEETQVATLLYGFNGDAYEAEPVSYLSSVGDTVGPLPSSSVEVLNPPITVPEMGLDLHDFSGIEVIPNRLQILVLGHQSFSLRLEVRFGKLA